MKVKQLKNQTSGPIGTEHGIELCDITGFYF